MDETSLGVSAAIAPFLPLLVSLLKRPSWPPAISMVTFPHRPAEALPVIGDPGDLPKEASDATS